MDAFDCVGSTCLDFENFPPSPLLLEYDDDGPDDKLVPLADIDADFVVVGVDFVVDGKLFG